MKTVKFLPLLLALILALPLGAVQAAEGDRYDTAMKERQRLFGNNCPMAPTDPEFTEIRDKLLLGQIWKNSPIPEEKRVLIVLASLAALDSGMGVGAYTGVGLRLKVEPVKMKEAIYHVTPYIGYPKAGDAIMMMNKTFEQMGVKLPLEKQGTVTEENRFQKGFEIQTRMFGDGIAKMHENTPKGQENLVVDYLSSWCFGDTYTRGAIDLQTRELLTLVAIISLGGCDSQVRSHVQGNLTMGNDRDTLVATLEILLPFIGYPRTLTALGIVNEVAK